MENFSEINKLVDIGYFLANQDKIEQLKNKKLSSAIGTLLKFQSGSYLLYDLNTQKISNITQNTAVFFNQALIKDIARSYDVLEDACSLVLESDFKELLVDNPILFGKEAEFYHGDDEFHIIDKETKEYCQKIPSKYFPNDIYSKFEFYDFSNYNHIDDEIKFDVRRNSHLERNKLLTKAGFFIDKADGITSTMDSSNDTQRDIIVKHGYSFGKRSTKFARDMSKTKLDLSFRLDYLTNSTLQLTGLGMELMAKLTKKAEMFTYGYLTGSDKYISRKTSRGTYTTYNYEYNKQTKKGRENIDSINTDYQSIINLMQYSINAEFTVDEFYEKLSNLSQNSSYIEFGLSTLLKSKPNKDTKPTLEAEIAKANIFLNSLLITLNKIDTINLDEFNGNLHTELTEVREFFENKKVIDKSIEIFNNIQSNAVIYDDKDLDTKKINELIKSFTVRTRAGVLDTKVDSYVLNMRDGLFELNDALKELCSADADIQRAVDNLALNKYYDYFELDRDYIDGKTANESQAINRLEFLNFTEALKDLKMPVREKGAFKIRKLGNHKASGIFFSGVNTIAVDGRFGNHFKSAKHEETHRIDISSQLNKIGRNMLVSGLDDYFRPRLNDNDRAGYYLKDVELIARAGEIASLLYEGNYKEHLKLFEQKEITEVELWDNIKNDYNLSNTRVLMKEFETYLESEVYIDFHKASVNGSIEKKLINNLLEYYKPFYSSDLTDVLKLTSSFSSGNEFREVEGIKTENFVHLPLRPHEKEAITAKEVFIDSFNTFNVDFSTKGTKEVVNILQEIKDGSGDLNTLKEQVSNGVLSLDDVIADREAFFTILTDDDFKDYVKESFRDKGISFTDSVNDLILHHTKDKPDEAVLLLRANAELMQSRLHSSSLFNLLVRNENKLDNISHLFVEFAKGGLSKGEIKRVFKIIDKNDNNASKIISENIASSFSDSGWGINDKLLVDALYHGISFSKEDVEVMQIKDFDNFKTKFLDISSYKNSCFNDEDSFVNKKVSLEKIEQFLQQNNIDYNRGELLYNALINKNPHGVDRTQVEVSTIEVETIFNLIVSDEKENPRHKAQDIVGMINCLKYPETSQAQLYIDVISKINDDEIINFMNFESLSRVLAFSNKYSDFKDAINYDFKLEKTNAKIQENALLYRFLNSINNSESRGAKELSLASDVLKKSIHDIGKSSLFSFYLAGKEKRFDICVEMLGEFKGRDLPKVAGIMLVLNHEQGIDIKDKISKETNRLLSLNESEKFFDIDKTTIDEMVVDMVLDRTDKIIKILGNWTDDATRPETIVRNLFSHKASDLKNVPDEVSEALTGLIVFSKDIDDSDVSLYKKRDSEALRSFISNLPIGNMFYKQDIVNIKDKDSFRFGIKDTQELKDIKNAVSKELNLFSCISLDNMKHSFARTLSKTLNSVSVIVEPPKISDINFSVLKDHEYFKENEGLFRDMKLSALHGIIDNIQSTSPNAPILEKLIDVSDKISYHSLKQANPYLSDSELVYDISKLNSGLRVVDDILSKEQFKDFAITINHNNYTLFTQAVEIQQQYYRDNPNSIETDENLEVITSKSVDAISLVTLRDTKDDISKEVEANTKIDEIEAPISQSNSEDEEIDTQTHITA